MVENHTDDGTEKDSPIGRRRYLTLTAAAVGSLATVGKVTANNGFEPQEESSVSVETNTVINLEDEGLTNGDVIDDYLEDHFDDGVEVRIPEGEYDWNGRGFHRQANENAAVVGEGEVILNLQNSSFNNNIRATNGVIALRNFTVRGKPSEPSRFRLEASSSGHVLVENLNFPDGSEEGADSRPFYSPQDHAGVVEIRNCYFHNFSNNGIYASSPGKGDDGQLIVENCIAHNNNIAGIRIGSSNSIVRNCVILNDAAAPQNHRGQLNMRGIRVRERGNDIRIENCMIIHSFDGAGAPIQLHRGAEGGSGTIVDTQILNNTGNDAIGGSGSTASEWSTDNVSISGDGDLSVHSNMDVCTGGDCHEVSDGLSIDDIFSNFTDNDSISESPEEDDNETPGSEDQSSDADESESEDDHLDEFSDTAVSVNPDFETESWHELTIITDNSGGINYDITTTGQIRMDYERERYNANRPAPTDYVRSNIDGTWTAIGSTAGGGHSGDSFKYRGKIVDVHIVGDLEGVTVLHNGSEVDLEDLIEFSAGPNADISNKLFINGGNDATTSRYSFTVTGDIKPDTAFTSSMDAASHTQFEIDGNKVSGEVTKGLTGFQYTGEILDLTVDGVATTTTLDLSTL